MATYIIKSSEFPGEGDLTAKLMPSGKVIVKGHDGVTERRIAADTLAKRDGNVLATLTEFYLRGNNAHYYKSITKVD